MNLQSHYMESHLALLDLSTCVRVISSHPTAVLGRPTWAYATLLLVCASPIGLGPFPMLKVVALKNELGFTTDAFSCTGSFRVPEVGHCWLWGLRLWLFKLFTTSIFWHDVLGMDAFTQLFSGLRILIFPRGRWLANICAPACPIFSLLP